MRYSRLSAGQTAREISEKTRAGGVPTNGDAYPCPACGRRMDRAATIETTGELVSISEEYRCPSCGHDVTIAQGTKPVPLEDGDAA